MARAFPADRIPVQFEITGDRALARSLAGLSHVRVVPEVAWPDYLRAQAGRTAAVMLAPLTDSPVNGARAPVKAFDAARLGATGLYADAAPYAGFVRGGEDGVLAPMRVHAWVEALTGLMADTLARRAMAAVMGRRLAQMRRSISSVS